MRHGKEKRRDTGKIEKQARLVAVFGRVVFGRDHQSPALPRTAIHGLNNVNELVRVIERPIDFVVISRSEINHDVLVSEEEHDRARIIQLVPERQKNVTSGPPRWDYDLHVLHLIKIWHLGDIHEISHGKILHFVGYFV